MLKVGSRARWGAGLGEGEERRHNSPNIIILYNRPMKLPNRSQPFPSNPNDSASEPALAVETEKMRQALRGQWPQALAARVGATYTAQAPDRGTFSFDLWGSPVTLAFPELVACRESGAPLPLAIQALLIYYLRTSDGSAPVGEWVSFADLPGGRIYAQAFQGYSGNQLVRAFGEDLSSFRKACLAAGGRPVALGDAAFAFAVLPRVPLLVTYWQGEDEFPSSSQVLFDPTATQHLPIDVCAILGSMLVSRILKVHRASSA